MPIEQIELDRRINEIEQLGKSGQKLSFQIEVQYTQGCSPGQTKQIKIAIQKVNQTAGLQVQGIQRATDRFDRNHLNALYGAERSLIASPAAASFSEEWWFSYFYKERKSSASWAKHEQKVLTFFNTMFQFPAEWAAPSGLLPPLTRALVPKMSWSQLAAGHPAVLKDMLDVLLEDGFVRVAAGTADSVAPADPSYVLASRFSWSPTGGHKVALFWRGESRSFEDLRQAGGLVNKAQSDYQGWAASKNFRAPWHPFSDAAKARDYWYRRGSSDNCLMTVVSVTADPFTAVTFPLLSDVEGLTFPGDWSASTASHPLDPALRPKYPKFSVVNPGQRIAYADSVQLYLVILDSEYFDTGAYQEGEGAEGFPELAVKSVDYPNIMASFSVVRVFNGSKDTDGFVALVNLSKSSPPNLDRCKRKLNLADGNAKILLDAVNSRFQQAVSMHGKAYRWTSSGAEEMLPRSTSRIAEVKLGDGTTLWTTADGPGAS